MPGRFVTPRGRKLALLILGACLLGVPLDARAQSAESDAAVDAGSARTDALFATPNRQTPVAPDNLVATTPGLERQIPRPQVNINILAPLLFNSNAESASSGGTATAEGSPLVRLSVAAPVGDLPLRLSATVDAEWDRYASADANGAEFDKLRPSLRLQYVDSGNDQAYSPFIAFVPRIDFEPTFARQFATRYDLNLGINKVFNFDGKFDRIPLSGNSSASTVWSFGFTAGVQRRWRVPSPSSYAAFFVPSASYVISEDWNAELVLDITRRWFDANAGLNTRTLTVEPVGVLEYVVPARWMGGADTARLFGRPAVDFLVGYERNWSNTPGGTYSQWVAGFALKAGWRF